MSMLKRLIALASTALMLLCSASALAMPITIIWTGEVTSNTLSRPGEAFESTVVTGGETVTVTAIVDDVNTAFTTGFFAYNLTDTSGISVNIGGSTLFGVPDTVIQVNTQDTFAFFDGVNLTQTGLSGATNYTLLGVVTDLLANTLDGTANLDVGGIQDPQTLADNQGIYATTGFTVASVIEDFEVATGTDYGQLEFIVSTVQIGDVPSTSVPAPAPLALLGVGILLLSRRRRS